MLRYLCLVFDNCSTLGKRHGLELREVCDVSFNVQIRRQLDAQVARLAMFFFVDLDDANQRLVLYLWIVVEDEVEVVIENADALVEKLVESLYAVLLQVDVLRCRNRTLL